MAIRIKQRISNYKIRVHWCNSCQTQTRIRTNHHEFKVNIILMFTIGQFRSNKTGRYSNGFVIHNGLFYHDGHLNFIN